MCWFHWCNDETMAALMALPVLRWVWLWLRARLAHGREV